MCAWLSGTSFSNSVLDWHTEVGYSCCVVHMLIVRNVFCIVSNVSVLYSFHVLRPG